jgi:hypothetical protein
VETTITERKVHPNKDDNSKMWYISVSLVFGVLFQNGLIQAKIEREAQYPQGGGTKLLTYNVTTP